MSWDSISLYYCWSCCILWDFCNGTFIKILTQLPNPANTQLTLYTKSKIGNLMSRALVKVFDLVPTFHLILSLTLCEAEFCITSKLSSYISQTPFQSITRSILQFPVPPNPVILASFHLSSNTQHSPLEILSSHP